MDSELDDNYGQGLNYTRLGSLYTRLSRFDSDKIYLEKSMAFAAPTSANEIFRDNYRDLATYYEKVGQPDKAIYFYKQFNTLSDSIFNKQTPQSLATYRTLYQLETTQHQIHSLTKDNDLTKPHSQ